MTEHLIFLRQKMQIQKNKHFIFEIKPYTR